MDRRVVIRGQPAAQNQGEEVYRDPGDEMEA